MIREPGLCLTEPKNPSDWGRVMHAAVISARHGQDVEWINIEIAA